MHYVGKFRAPVKVQASCTYIESGVLKLKYLGAHIMKIREGDELSEPRIFNP
jgi:hypothetical protein